MKKLFAVAFILYLSVLLCSCKSANEIESPKTEYSVMINSGSEFVYTFKDQTTGVWYIATTRGLTPRYNSDGTLFTD